MAVTFRGAAQSLNIVGNDAVAQNLFVIENGIASRVNIILRRLLFGSDALAVLTSVMNTIKVSRCTAVSGGVQLHKAPFLTSQTSDPAVVIRAQANETALITATAGDTMWTQFVPRMHTAVEQQQPEIDKENRAYRSLIPVTATDTTDIVIRPGQAMLVKVIAATAASNAQTSMNYAVRCMWEEDAIATFAISGTVTLSGSPVSGAIVTVIEADDASMTNAVLREVIVTPAGGTWASSIRTGKVGAAFVQYENGGTKYTAPGSPYLA
jgi:hypothetical protein